MTFPCEYCGQPVEDAESFMRLGVGPCCHACRRVPLALGLAWLAFACLVVAFGIWAWISFA